MLWQIELQQIAMHEWILCQFQYLSELSKLLHILTFAFEAIMKM